LRMNEEGEDVRASKKERFKRGCKKNNIFRYGEIGKKRKNRRVDPYERGKAGGLGMKEGATQKCLQEVPRSAHFREM